MADNRFGDYRPEHKLNLFDDDNDDFSLTNEDSFRDNFRDDYSLTSDDSDFDTPLTSRRSSFDGYSDYDDEGSLESTSSNTYDTKPRQSGRRRETISRMAEEYRNGTATPPPTGNRFTREMPRDPRRQPLDNKRKNAQAARRRRENAETEKSKPKSKFAAFYIGMLVLAVGVCLAVFFVVLQMVMERGIGIDTSLIHAGQGSGVLQSPGADINIPTDIGQDIRNISAVVISSHVTNPRHLTVLDINNMRNREFTVPEAASINNRMNQAMTFSQIRAGQLIDISYNSRNAEVSSIRENAHSWERRGRTNVEIDMEAFTITSGHDVFNFNSRTIITRNGEPFPISLVTPMDTVTLSGFANDVWMIQMELSHGFLEIYNTDMITNGRMHIGMNHFPTLDDVAEPISLPEGTHRVVVDGDNIETFVETVTIEQGQTTRVNLGDAEMRNAVLQIVTSPPDAQVFVNGELLETTGPIPVSFGEQLIRVESEGFIPQEQTVDITLPMSTLQFELIELTRTATIIVFTHPTNAQVFIDNVFVGYSTITTDVAPGERRITARLPGHADASVERILVPEEEDFVHLLLTPTIAGEQEGMPHPMPDPIPTPEQTLPTVPGVPPGTIPGAPTVPGISDPVEPTAPTTFEPVPLPTLPPGGGITTPVPTLPPLQGLPPATEPTQPPWNPFVPANPAAPGL